MNAHKKKMIAPIIVSVLMVLYYVLYFGVLIALLDGLFWKILLGIAPLAMSALTVAVCIQRIQEIKKGEEDDISQY